MADIPPTTSSPPGTDRTPDQQAEDRLVKEFTATFNGPDHIQTDDEWSQVVAKPENNLGDGHIWKRYGENALKRLLNVVKEHKDWNFQSGVLGMMRAWPKGKGLSQNERKIVVELLDRSLVHDLTATFDEKSPGGRKQTKEEWLAIVSQPGYDLLTKSNWNDYGKEAINSWLRFVKDHPGWEVHAGTLETLQGQGSYGVEASLAKEILERQQGAAAAEAAPSNTTDTAALFARILKSITDKNGEAHLAIVKTTPKNATPADYRAALAVCAKIDADLKQVDETHGATPQQMTERDFWAINLDQEIDDLQKCIDAHVGLEFSSANKSGKKKNFQLALEWIAVRSLPPLRPADAETKATFQWIAAMASAHLMPEPTKPEDSRASLDAMTQAEKLLFNPDISAANRTALLVHYYPMAQTARERLLKTLPAGERDSYRPRQPDEAAVKKTLSEVLFSYVADDDHVFSEEDLGNFTGLLADSTGSEILPWTIPIVKEALDAFFNSMISGDLTRRRVTVDRAVRTQLLAQADRAHFINRALVQKLPVHNAGLRRLTSDGIQAAEALVETGTARKDAPPPPPRDFKAEAEAMYQAEKFKDAVPLYRQAIEASPQDMDLYNHLGACQFQTKDYAGAVETFERALKIKPNEALTIYDLAYAYRKVPDYNKAVDMFRRYISLKPNDPDPYFGLATSLKALGKIAEAIEAFKTYIAKEQRPENSKWVEIAKKELATLEAAKPTSQSASDRPAAKSPRQPGQVDIAADMSTGEATAKKELLNTTDHLRNAAAAAGRTAVTSDKAEGYQEAFAAFSAALEPVKKLAKLQNLREGDFQYTGEAAEHLKTLRAAGDQFTLDYLARVERVYGAAESARLPQDKKTQYEKAAEMLRLLPEDDFKWAGGIKADHYYATHNPRFKPLSKLRMFKSNVQAQLAVLASQASKTPAPGESTEPLTSQQRTLANQYIEGSERAVRVTGQPGGSAQQDPRAFFHQQVRAKANACYVKIKQDQPRMMMRVQISTGPQGQTTLSKAAVLWRVNTSKGPFVQGDGEAIENIRDCTEKALSGIALGSAAEINAHYIDYPILVPPNQTITARVRKSLVEAAINLGDQAEKSPDQAATPKPAATPSPAPAAAPIKQDDRAKPPPAAPPKPKPVPKPSQPARPAPAAPQPPPQPRNPREEQ